MASILFEVFIGRKRRFLPSVHWCAHSMQGAEMRALTSLTGNAENRCGTAGMEGRQETLNPFRALVSLFVRCAAWRLCDCLMYVSKQERGYFCSIPNIREDGYILASHHHQHQTELQELCRQPVSAHILLQHSARSIVMQRSDQLATDVCGSL